MYRLVRVKEEPPKSKEIGNQPNDSCPNRNLLPFPRLGGCREKLGLSKCRSQTTCGLAKQGGAGAGVNGEHIVNPGWEKSRKRSLASLLLAFYFPVSASVNLDEASWQLHELQFSKQLFLICSLISLYKCSLCQFLTACSDPFYPSGVPKQLRNLYVRFNEKKEHIYLVF